MPKKLPDTLKVSPYLNGYRDSNPQAGRYTYGYQNLITGIGGSETIVPAPNTLRIGTQINSSVFGVNGHGKPISGMEWTDMPKEFSGLITHDTGTRGINGTGGRGCAVTIGYDIEIPPGWTREELARALLPGIDGETISGMKASPLAGLSRRLPSGTVTRTGTIIFDHSASTDLSQRNTTVGAGATLDGTAFFQANPEKLALYRDTLASQETGYTPALFRSDGEQRAPKIVRTDTLIGLINNLTGHDPVQAMPHVRWETAHLPPSAIPPSHASQGPSGTKTQGQNPATPTDPATMPSSRAGSSSPAQSATLTGQAHASPPAANAPAPPAGPVAPRPATGQPSHPQRVATGQQPPNAAALPQPSAGAVPPPANRVGPGSSQPPVSTTQMQTQQPVNPASAPPQVASPLPFTPQDVAAEMPRYRTQLPAMPPHDLARVLNVGQQTLVSSLSEEAGNKYSNKPPAERLGLLLSFMGANQKERGTGLPLIEGRLLTSATSPVAQSNTSQPASPAQSLPTVSARTPYIPPAPLAAQPTVASMTVAAAPAQPRLAVPPLAPAQSPAGQPPAVNAPTPPAGSADAEAITRMRGALNLGNASSLTGPDIQRRFTASYVTALATAPPQVQQAMASADLNLRARLVEASRAVQLANGEVTIAAIQAEQTLAALHTEILARAKSGTGAGNQGTGITSQPVNPSIPASAPKRSMPFGSGPAGGNTTHGRDGGMHPSGTSPRKVIIPLEPYDEFGLSRRKPERLDRILRRSSLCEEPVDSSFCAPVVITHRDRRYDW